MSFLLGNIVIDRMNYYDCDYEKGIYLNDFEREYS